MMFNVVQIYFNKKQEKYTFIDYNNSRIIEGHGFISVSSSAIFFQTKWLLPRRPYQ